MVVVMMVVVVVMMRQNNITKRRLDYGVVMVVMMMMVMMIIVVLRFFHARAGSLAGIDGAQNFGRMGDRIQQVCIGLHSQYILYACWLCKRGLRGGGRDKRRRNRSYETNDFFVHSYAPLWAIRVIGLFCFVIFFLRVFRL